jgi:uncharacterized damage-inducible protein DinB
MTKKEIQLLFDYDQWADMKLLEALAVLKPDQYTKDLGASFGGIQGTLVHILSANKVWLNRWAGKTPEPLKADDFPTIEVLKKAWDTYHFDCGNFSKSLSEDNLNASLQYVDFKGNSYNHPLYQQVQHKVNHSSYHRGQIVTLLRQMGVQAVSTDMINYIRQKDNS